MKNNKQISTSVEQLDYKIVEDNQSYEAKTIFILTYSKNNTLSQIYVDSLAKTIRIAAFNGIKVFPIIIGQLESPTMAKNEMLNTIHTEDYISAIFVDSDLAWDPISLLEIALNNEHAIALPVVKKIFNNTIFDLAIDVENINKNNDGFIEVNYASVSMFKLSKSLVDELLDSSLSVTGITGNEIKNVFEYKIKDGNFYNESGVLCEKIKDMGYKVWLNPTTTCGQVADNIYASDFNESLQQQIDQKIIVENPKEQMELELSEENTEKDEITNLYS